MHEASLHKENCFLTLTYSDENLPPDRSLVKSDFQKFMKRLRDRFDYKPIKFFHCGEYGEQELRPHYHAAIFGHDFPDKEVWRVRDGIPLYISDLLDSLWKKGFSTIGDVTFESAAYIARYCVKKVNGKKADLIDPETGLKHYERVHLYTGEINEVLPEYTTMSRGGRTGRGIASDWFDSFHGDVYPNDFCVVNGYENRPPRYYDDRFELLDPDGLEEIKARRVETMRKHRHNNTPERLAVREQVKKAQVSFLKRDEVK